MEVINNMNYIKFQRKRTLKRKKSLCQDNTDSTKNF